MTEENNHKEFDLEFERKMGEMLNELHDRGAITYDERTNLGNLFLEYGWFRYKEGFDEGLYDGLCK